VLRFGLGRRGAEALPHDPEPWLAAQLDGPDPALALPGAGLAQCLTALRDDFRRKTDGLQESRAILQAEAARALDYTATTDTPFRERLVWFWANQFTVSLRRGGVVALAHAYLREAIRPHVTGRFEACSARRSAIPPCCSISTTPSRSAPTAGPGSG
jgi:Protein of unknown function (DUF1800)